MVIKNQQKYIPDEAPPFDESWWEAVLAEDEARNPSHLPRTAIQPANGMRSNPAHPPLEQVIVDWQNARNLYEKDQPVIMHVSGFNRGGLLVCGEKLQGFVPVSHLVDTPDDDQEPEQWLARYLMLDMRLKIIECDPERGRVVFSERAALAETGVRNHLLGQLRPGDCVVGVVTNMTEFGIFVDLGGVEGLVHVSEISWGRVHHPADVVQVGQQVKVYVINVDRERARVALSLKRLCSNPWETAQQRYHEGQVTGGIITSVVPFGAFARLEEGLDGLIHISEMDCDGVGHKPADILSVGQKVMVRILHVDSARQRLGLSLKLDSELE